MGFVGERTRLETTGNFPPGQPLLKNHGTVGLNKGVEWPF